MKRFFVATACFVLLAGVVLLVFHLVKPLIFDELENWVNGFFDPPAITENEEGNVTIKSYVYTQDPESGEYLLTEESYEIPKGNNFFPALDAPAYHTLNEEKSITAIENAQEGDVLTYYFDCETCEVTFLHGESDENVQTTLRKGETPTAPAFTHFGYTLTGFDKKLAPVYEDTTYTAVWEILRFTLRLYATADTKIGDISFARRADTPSCFEKTFTAFDDVTLPTPTSEGYTFQAWNTSADGMGDAITAIQAGTANDISLYAIYDVRFYAIDFAPVDGVTYPSYYLPYNTAITSPAIAPANQKPGYGLNWYSDKACTMLYGFDTIPAENITLYGKWELDTSSGFLGWDTDLTKETVDSFEELAALVDYVRFHEFDKSIEMEVTYADKETVKKDLARVDLAGEFRANGAYNYAVSEKTSYTHENAKCEVSVISAKSYRDMEASLSTEPTTETSYQYLTEVTTGRGGDYHDFYIDALPFTYSVTTTNQLHYVAEHGYRPLPTPGSDAERIYHAAKALLNRIIPENATEFEKVEAIFTYLVQNIQYDDNAVTIAEKDSSTWPLYDAFFMEGVFDNQKAVCDGIAKAFSLLCNMEGIPCVEVVGDSHAWNRVKLNNHWYVADATFGNLHIKSENRSIMDHSRFLISDSKMTELGFSSESYSHIKATENYEYFAKKIRTVGSKSFDYRINSVDELALMLEYLLSLNNDLHDTSIDFVYEINGISFSDAYSAAVKQLSQRGVRFSFSCRSYGGDYGTVYKTIFLRR